MIFIIVIQQNSKIHPAKKPANAAGGCQGKQLCLYIVLTCYYSVKTISNKEDITQLYTNKSIPLF